MKRLVFVAIIAAVLSVLAYCYGQPVEARQLPTRLLTEADLIHQGSFTIPLAQDLNSATTAAPQYCAYTNGKIALNPAGNGGLGSLFVACHEHSQTVMEISIPSPGGVATVLQAPRDPFGGKLAQIQPPTAISGTRKVGGMWVVGNRLIITAYVYYDADPANQAVRSHFVRSTNLSDPTVVGPFTVGTGYGGKWAGFFSAVPTEWQAALGCSLLNGVSPHAITSIWSQGPAAACVDPAQLLAATSPSAATPLVYYPYGSSTTELSAWDSTGPLYNGTTELGGLIAVPNTATLIFGGIHGMGQFLYSVGATASPYEPHLWFYNLHDLAAVKAGTLLPYEARPYRTGRLPVMNRANLGGLAYDAATGRIVATENLGDPDNIRPRFHIYTVSGASQLPPPPPPPPPPGDTEPPVVTSFAVTPSTLALEQATTLTATATDNVGVVAVDFLNGGTHVMHTDTTAPYSYVWPGIGSPNVFTFSARARDAAGNVGVSAPVTVTIGGATPPPPPPADTTSPTIASLTVTPTAPTVGQPVELTASASDNVGVVGVQFTLDGAPLGPEDTTVPYTATWTPPSAGTFTTRATARDAAGNLASLDMPVTVSAIPPPLPTPCDLRVDVDAWPVQTNGRRTQTRYTIWTSAAVAWVTYLDSTRMGVADSNGCTAEDRR